MKPSKILGMPAAQYHAIPYANASSLKTIRKSVAHMLAPRKESTAFDLGTAVHSLVLEGLDAFRERTAIRPKEFKDYRSKDARTWRDSMKADGLEVITRDEADLVKRAAKSVSECDAAAELLMRAKPRESQREVTYLWQDDVYDVPCKCRYDAVGIDAGRLIGVDLKTTQSAHPDEFTRSIIKYGYDLQAAHYRVGLEAVEGEELLAFVIIAVETVYPFGVAVYQITEDWLQRGLEQREIAMEAFADWHHAGRPTDAPVYPTTIEQLEMPRWA